jgi:hypothetical protein
MNIFSAAWKLNPDEYIFCSLKTKHNKRIATRPKFFFRREYYTNKDHKPEKLSWGPISVKIISLGRKLGTTEEQDKDWSCLFRLRDNRKKKGHNFEKKCLGL